MQREIRDEFLEKIVKKVNRIRVGDPLDPETQMGALISEEHLQKVIGFMDIAKKEVFFRIVGIRYIFSSVCSD